MTKLLSFVIHIIFFFSIDIRWTPAVGMTITYYKIKRSKEVLSLYCFDCVVVLVDQGVTKQMWCHYALRVMTVSSFSRTCLSGSSIRTSFGICTNVYTQKGEGKKHFPLQHFNFIYKSEGKEISCLETVSLIHFHCYSCFSVVIDQVIEGIFSPLPFSTILGDHLIL